MNKKSKVISLIGRPNVGKSSLFNRLMKRAHKTITFDTPGVTRDRHYGIATFDDHHKHEELDAILVDTGGFYPEKIDENENNYNKFFNIMTVHAEQSIAESDLVLFVVDAREGILPFDRQICDYIRAQKKKFFVLVNKYDSDNQAGDEAEFYSLGINEENLFPVSASHGLGIINLREKIHAEIDSDSSKSEKSVVELQKGVTPREKVVSRVAIIGAPNAGKSTLLNELLGAERALVSDIAGTTVDPIEGYFDLYFGHDAKKLGSDINISQKDGLLFKQYEDFRKNNPDVYKTMIDAYNTEESIGENSHLISQDTKKNPSDKVLLEKIFNAKESDELEADKEPEGSFWRSIHLVDTAGIRRKTSIDGFVESQSVYRSLRCITESDIVIYMIDGPKGMGHQDRRLIDIALEKGKSLILCFNKTDLLKEELSTDKKRLEWLQDIKDKAPWLSFCDIVTISAKEGKGLGGLKNSLKKTILVRRNVIPTGELNRYIFHLVDRNPIVAKGSRGSRLKVKYSSMVKTSPPTFLLFTNKSKGIPENFKRYLKNNLRHEFELDNTPIHIIFRTGADLEKRAQTVKGKGQGAGV